MPPEPKQGIPLVCEAVTAAASLLARLSRATSLDDRDRRDCAVVRTQLEAAEVVLYGPPPAP